MDVGFGRSLQGEDAVGKAAALRRSSIKITSKSRTSSSAQVARTSDEEETLSDVAQSLRQPSDEECASCEDIAPPKTNCKDQVQFERSIGCFGFHICPTLLFTSIFVYCIYR